MTSVKSAFLDAQGDSMPYWFQGKFCSFVCFELLVERVSFCLQSLISLNSGVNLKQLILLCYIICPCFYCVQVIFWSKNVKSGALNICFVKRILNLLCKFTILK